MATDRWSDRLARMDQAIDTVMSEALRFIPQRPGTYAAGGADPDRAPIDCMGLLTIHRGDVHTGGEQRHVFNSRLVSAEAELQVQRSVIPAGAKFREGDHWAALTKGVVYRISRIGRRHPGRLAFKLAEVATDEGTP